MYILRPQWIFLNKNILEIIPVNKLVAFLLKYLIEILKLKNQNKHVSISEHP